ncbi:MAG: glucose-6-phosphate isomerase [Chloroflexi bacterium]|nr:glucose-6-phosphate isomerase [Chloroflexota bacterium]
MKSLDLSAEFQIHPGPSADAYEHALADLTSARAAERIWAREGAFWSNDAQAIDEIEARLGWLDLPAHLTALRPSLERFAQQVRDAGITQALLLGMGGSSLAPEVLRLVFGVRPGWLDLRVVDTTDPIEVRDAAAQGDLAHTLIVVSSKSGTTAETRAQYLYFRSRLQEAVGSAWPQHFCVITDPGTPLAALARQENLLALFDGVSDVGGRFSALSVFGMLPAALLGVDLRRLARFARLSAASTQPEHVLERNTALQFGALMGGLARQSHHPRNKLTLLSSPRLRSFGAWAEQLVAESTGKRGTGIVPIDDEPHTSLAAADDRLFVYMRLDGDDNAAGDARARTLVTDGQPLVYLRLRNPYALGAEFVRWEFATAVAGQLLGVNPFDQPDVEAAKQQARRALAQYESAHHLDEPEPVLEDGHFALHGAPARVSDTVATYIRRWIDENAQPGGYVAITAYVDRSPQQTAALTALRAALARRTRLATTLGFGPRFLHSTGQLHKGGPRGGLFLQITRDDADHDLPIPGEVYTFGVLKRAQALGDLAALRAAGRTVLRIHLKGDGTDGIVGLAEILAAI